MGTQTMDSFKLFLLWVEFIPKAVGRRKHGGYNISRKIIDYLKPLM